MLFYKTYNKKITRWVWDGNTPLHEWIEASEKENKQPKGVITWVFDEGRFCPAARLVGDKAYSIITDYLGTPVQAYNESGKLKWETELDIYGKVRTFEGDKALIPFRYQGQYEDEETGLYYNRFRYYSPDEGIYLSQDPIGLSGGNPTIYGYVKDVNSWVDRLGLRCKKKVSTPYGDAAQVNTPEALAARGQVEDGATLYRIGTMGKSETVGAQFWALEHPNTPGYASRYGIPPENIANSDFIMTGKLKPGREFVTRPAPPVGSNVGGGIEVVTPIDGVELTTFSTL